MEEAKPSVMFVMVIEAPSPHEKAKKVAAGVKQRCRLQCFPP